MLKVASKYGLAAAAGLLIGITQSANAADLWGPDYGGSIKDATPAYAFSWTGVYVGAHAGLMTGNTQGRPDFGGDPLEQLFATDYDMNGGLFGGQIGYNYQIGSAVFGIEASYSGSTAQGDGQSALIFTSRRELDWLATVTGRAGYAMGKSLVYVKGGVAWGDVNSDVEILGIPFLSGSETHVGWTAGIGFEHAITNNITARIEYAHIDLGSEDHALKVNGFKVLDSQVDAEFDSVTIGINYKF